MVRKKALTIVFGVVLWNTCIAASADLQDLDLPMLERRCSGEIAEFTYSAQSVSSWVPQQIPEISHFNDVRTKCGDDIFSKIADAYFGLDNDIRYSQFGFELPPHILNNVVPAVTKISGHVYAVLNS